MKRELRIALGCFAVSGVFAIIAYTQAETRPPIVDGELMPMCGFKRGKDIIAVQCNLVIVDGKPVWSKAE